MSTVRYGLFILPGFDLVSFSVCCETLRLANDVARQKLYSWEVVTGSGQAVESASRIPVSGRSLAGESTDYDRLVVFAGNQATSYANRNVFDWLRQLSRRGCLLGGVDAGVWVLARAGLLGGYRFALGSGYHLAFRETFDLVPEPAHPFVLDRERLTWAGGGSAFEAMFEQLRQDHGRTLSSSVARSSRYPVLPETPEPQSTALPEKLATCLEIMKQNIEEPLSSAELAAAVGLSVRHLERLFHGTFQAAPQKVYRSLRLQEARRLVHFTELSITEISIATGFDSCSHFARCFRGEFDMTPSSWRRSRKGQRVEVEAGL
ncbi:GlxA family transcriptional regulator [Fodinicurvata halophila]|uniref:GlxA family transcriptional regulator n=1 Tax=Fodinicurvata halophila TaxID=1419723 RepID=A0ABV8UK59_9PROT